MNGAGWIWSRGVDLGVFVLPTLIALAFVWLWRGLNIQTGGQLPEWGWVVFVLGVDVAHVWATVYRTYFDKKELSKRPLFYALTPLLCWAVGVALHVHSSLTFWRALAYLAVFHFIRQQAGWVAIYRARGGPYTTGERVADDAVIYLSTGVPLLIWHTQLPKPFWWFVTNDFFSLREYAWVVVWAEIALASSVVLFIGYQLKRYQNQLQVQWGKIAVVATTLISWWVSIVWSPDDFSFTIINVMPHGVPYFTLLWMYAKKRAISEPTIFASAIVRKGLIVFLGVLVFCSFIEELLWDRLVWFDHPAIFGFLPEYPLATAKAWIVPLLALPQSTHYMLDAFIWRRGHTGKEQASAMGFEANNAAAE